MIRAASNALWIAKRQSKGFTPDTPLITRLGHAVVLGSALGIAQWVTLRQKVGQAGLWIVISIVAWIVAEIVGVALSSLAGPPLDLLGLFLVGGILPGAGMMWLLNHASTPPAPRTA